MGLRSAGFPVDRVLRLGSPACVEAADRRLTAGTDRDADAAYETAFAAGLAGALDEVAATARDPLFREAVTWQNRRALHTGVDVLLAGVAAGRSRSSGHRQKESLVVSYLGRYGTKNDTIGFFGPMGWARVVADGPLLASRPGPRALATRTTYLEGWCIDALAARLAADGALRPWLVPRRMPALHLDGAALHLPLTAPVALAPADAAVLAACDGERPAAELAAGLLEAGIPGLATAGDVFDALERLRAKRRIAWTLEVPAEDLWPERALRRLLAQVGDPDLRAPCLAALDDLEARRDAVAAAAGDAGRLDAALGDLDAAFTRLTGAEPVRRAGDVYAGRTLAYEDCRRDVDVRLGPAFAEAVGPPLALVLDSARWFVAEAAAGYRGALRELHAELAGGAGGPVPLPDLWLLAHPLLFGAGGPVVPALAARLQERWAAILDLPPGATRVHRTARDLRPAVDAAFRTAGRGWASTRHHSVDLLIGAPAEPGGEHRFVLGEIHAGVNLLKTRLFVAQHPSPADLLDAMDRDLPEPRVALVGSREPGGVTPRMSNGLVRDRDHRLVFAHDTCGVPALAALRLGDLAVEADADGTLVARTWDGRLRIELVELLGDLLAIRLLQAFQPLPEAAHAPRVEIDALVVQRETWRFPAAGLAFASARTEAARFLAARRWRRAHELPRLLFLRTPAERKPVFVDLDSPLGLTVTAKAVRRAVTADPGATVAFAEMLPDPSQAWLADAAGRRYTSELRIVTVDRR